MPAAAASSSTERRILVCCGSGGVGKTTTAAVARARGGAGGAGGRSSSPSTRPSGWPTPSGSRASPARPRRIEGDWPGELWALMLDTKSTFDDLVVANAADAGAGRADPRQPLLPEHLRRAVGHAGVHGDGEALRAAPADATSTSSSSTRRRPATPSTSSTRPRRLTRFLDHRLFRMLIAPARGVMKAVNVAAQAFLRTVAKVVGGEVIDDAIAFFQRLRGDGGGLPGAGRRGARAPAPPTRRRSCSSPRRGATRSRRPRSSPRKLARGRHPGAGARRQPHAPDASARAWPRRRGSGPPRSRAPTSAASTRNLADFQLGRRARGGPPRRPGRARWRRRRSCGCRSCPTDVHDLDGLADARRR